MNPVSRICLRAGVTLSAAALAGWFAQNHLWLAVQRYVMGLVLGVLAVKLLSQQRKGIEIRDNLV